MKALVTGGGGFLGRAIVERLLARGDSVSSLSRRDYPELRAIGATTMRGDLSDRDAVAAACQACDVVFHVAAKPGLGGRYEDYHRPNVVGTENVLAGCREHRVQRLVYTSSPSVVFDGLDMEGADESAPYPDDYHAHYPRTKAIAEKLVLAANDDRLATVSLRPHLIWGPRDNHLVPEILKRAKRLRRIGHEDKPVDSVYIDNAADAHLLAADRLAVGGPVAGRSYFISQGEPRGVWELINGILAAADRSPVTRRMPKGVALAAAATVETIFGLLRLKGDPPLTRFMVHELSTAHWFDISAARRDLGYEPKVSIDEGLARLKVWFGEQRENASV